MRINAISQSIQTELRKIKNAKKAEKNQISTRNNPVDQPVISSGGQRLNSVKASIESISSAISVQSEIRTDKISEVQKKIESGFYNSPEFIEKLAEKLLKEFGIKAPPQ